MYNLNTKKAIVEEDGSMIWVSGSFGSHVSCLYPDTILQGDRSKCEFTGISFAGKGQFLDTGCKVESFGKDTSLNINSKSISKGGGTCLYRGVVHIGPRAKGTKGTISCESLMLDSLSRSDTIPDIIIENDDIDLGHEAKIGRISDGDIYYLMSRGISEEEAKAMLVRGFAEPISKALPLEYAVDLGHEAKIGRISDGDIYYLMSRGISEEEAKAMLVRGFAEPISKALPLEYAVEMNRLIDLEFEGSIG